MIRKLILTGFLLYDTYGIYTPAYLLASEHSNSLSGATHFWNQDTGFFTVDNLKNIKELLKENDRNEYLNPIDIRNFLAMQPSRQAGDVDIKYYIINKFIRFFSRIVGEDYFHRKRNGELDIIEDLFI